jgi:hypothetical protein
LSASSGLETRGLHSLTRKEAVDRAAMDAEDPPDPHGVEPSVVDQTPNRLGVDAELGCDLPNADESCLLSVCR